MNISEIISEELSLKLNSVDAAIKLIDEGNTIPFIARYRKEATNYLTDNDLRKLEERLIYLRKLDDLKDAYNGVITRYPKDHKPLDLINVKWMLEELRVSYFAQQIGVKGPISDKRIYLELQRIVKDFPPMR